MPKEFANAQDLVAVKEIRDNTLVLKDGGLRQVLMVAGINFALRSEAEQGIITGAYQNFLNSVDFPLQVVIHSRKINIEKYLKKLEGFEEAEPSPLLRNQNSEYREFIRGFVEKNAIMEKTFFVVVPWVSVQLPSASSFTGFLPFLKKKEEKTSADRDRGEEAFRTDLDQLNQRVSSVIDGLAAVGLQAVALTNQELIELLYNFYNPEAVEKENLAVPKRQ